MADQNPIKSTPYSQVTIITQLPRDHHKILAMLSSELSIPRNKIYEALLWYAIFKSPVSIYDMVTAFTKEKDK